MNLIEHFKDPNEVAKWKEMFAPTDEVIGHHEIYNKLRNERPDVARMLPKFIFYAANFIVFGQPTEKDKDGSLGYRMNFVQPPVAEKIDRAADRKSVSL